MNCTSGLYKSKTLISPVEARYQTGIVSRLEVLDAQRQAFAAEQGAIQARREGSVQRRNSIRHWRVKATIQQIAQRRRLPSNDDRNGKQNHQ
jgi:hypothetical protein